METSNSISALEFAGIRVEPLEYKEELNRDGSLIIKAMIHVDKSLHSKIKQISKNQSINQQTHLFVVPTQISISIKQSRNFCHPTTWNSP